LTKFISQGDCGEIEKKYCLFEYEDERLFKNHEIFWPLPDEEKILMESDQMIDEQIKEKYQPKEVKKNFKIFL